MDDSVSALGALYQGEKADASAIFNVAMAMMGIGAAYLVGVVTLADRYGSSPLTWNVVLLLPLPLWLIAAFHSLITLNAMIHGVSIRVIEDKLFEIANFGDNCIRDLIGSQAGDKIMEIRNARWPHKIATGLVYGGVGIAILLYTAFVVIGFFVIHDSWNGVEIIKALSAVVGYLLVAAIVINSWVVGLIEIGKADARRPLFPTRKLLVLTSNPSTDTIA